MKINVELKENEGETEIKNLRQINHKRLLKYNEIILKGNRLSALAEEKDILCLRDYFKKLTNIQEKLLKHILGQVIEGLEYLASKKIRRANISPQWIYIDHENNIYLADYGVIHLSCEREFECDPESKTPDALQELFRELIYKDRTKKDSGDLSMYSSKTKELLELKKTLTMLTFKSYAGISGGSKWVIFAISIILCVVAIGVFFLRSYLMNYLIKQKNDYVEDYVSMPNGEKYKGEFLPGTKTKSGKGVLFGIDGSRYEGDFVDDRKEGFGTITYLTTESYTGQWKNNTKQGRGMYKSRDKSVYEGEFQNGKKQGFAKYTYSSGDFHEGYWKDNKMNGPGTLYYAQGNRLECTWENNEAFGNCTFIFRNKDKYVGYWKNNAANGNGSFYSKSKLHYTGGWENNEKHGKGIMYLNSNEFYEGDFAKGQPHGFGAYTSPTETYRGEFHNGTRSGRGELRLKNGEIYTGNFLKNKKHGKGTFIYSNGDKYAGEFVNDLKHGYGKATSAKGETYEGDWKLGYREGNGTYKFSSGAKYVGEWKNNKKHGRGKYYDTQGIIADTIWEEDRAVGPGTATTPDGLTHQIQLITFFSDYLRFIAF